MAGVDDLVRQAEAAYKAGRKDQAQSLLLQAVEQDERHERAWLMLSTMVDSLEERQICLENVLTVNPANAQARKWLDTVMQKLSPPGGTPAQPPPPTPVETNSFDDWLTASTDPFPTPDEDSVIGGLPTSVDWGRSDAPAAYGSGRAVAEPSAQEYDDWMNSLNLSGDSPANSAQTEPFATTFETPFGDTSFMIVDDESFDDEPAVNSADVFGSSPFGTEDAFAAFGDAPVFETDEPEDDEPEPVNASFGESAFGSPFSTFDSPDEPSFLEEEEAEEDFDSDWLQNRLGSNSNGPVLSPVSDEFEAEPAFAAPAFAATAKPPAAKKPASPGKDYYRLIPADIQMKSGGIDRQTMLLLGGIMVLALLNLISFGYLIASL